MVELLDYETSPLNPILKMVIAFMFLIVAFLYYDARKKYGGNVRNFIDLLFLFALFVLVASTLRYFGHGTDFGFTKDYSLKWFQSIAYVVAGFIYVLAGKNLVILVGDD